MSKHGTVVDKVTGDTFRLNTMKGNRIRECQGANNVYDSKSMSCVELNDMSNVSLRRQYAKNSKLKNYDPKTLPQDIQCYRSNIGNCNKLNFCYYSRGTKTCNHFGISVNSGEEENAIIDYAEKLVESDTKKYMSLKPVILIYRCIDKYLDQQKSEIVNLQVMSHKKDCEKIDHDYVTKLVEVAVELKKSLNRVKVQLLREIDQLRDNGGEDDQKVQVARPITLHTPFTREEEPMSYFDK
jgi:hypothetical protein